MTKPAKKEEKKFTVPYWTREDRCGGCNHIVYTVYVANRGFIIDCTQPGCHKPNAPMFEDGLGVPHPRICHNPSFYGRVS